MCCRFMTIEQQYTMFNIYNTIDLIYVSCLFVFLLFSDFSYNSQSLFDMVNDLPDELLGPSESYQNSGNDNDTQNHIGKQDSSQNKHVQLSALLQNNPSQSSPVPSRSPNVMNNPVNSIRSPLSNSLSSPPHNSMMGKAVSAGSELNFASSSASYMMSNTNTVNSMGTMASNNVMSSLGSHASSIPSGMTGYSMAQRNPMMHNGPQYAVSGQGRGTGIGQQLTNLPQSGMLNNINNPNLQARMNMVHPGLQPNASNQSQLMNVSDDIYLCTVVVISKGLWKGQGENMTNPESRTVN